jgi:hypothetical protein
MREEGPKGLFKGLTPIMLRAFPANAVSHSREETKRRPKTILKLNL